MAYYKTINTANIKSVSSNLNQLIDFADSDVSGSVTDTTRKTYNVFVTGSQPGVTSSLFHTVFDQTTTLQSSNELFDLTVGIASGSTVVSETAASPSEDTAGKFLFVSNSLMMREKIDVYRQHAQLLLGNGSSTFVSPFGSTTASDKITEALFINLKRLFVRDGIKKESFAMRFMTSASSGNSDEDGALGASGQQNLFRETGSGSIIIVDSGNSTATQNSPTGGEYGTLKNAADNSAVGLIFYQMGTVILDLDKITSGTQFISGAIDATTQASQTIGGATIPAGKTVMGTSVSNPNAKFIPDFLGSGSIDNILDHICTTRFHSASTGLAQNKTFMTFQNNTKLNSTLVFCRAAPDEFNVSSNPTFVNSSGIIRTIDGEQNEDKSFTFVTTVGLYDANRTLMAVSKLSRPVEKNDEKDLTFRIRLDF